MGWGVGSCGRWREKWIHSRSSCWHRADKQDCVRTHAHGFPFSPSVAGDRLRQFCAVRFGGGVTRLGVIEPVRDRRKGISGGLRKRVFGRRQECWFGFRCSMPNWRLWRCSRHSVTVPRRTDDPIKRRNISAHTRRPIFPAPVALFVIRMIFIRVLYFDGKPVWSKR